ncbi:MAG: ABC transporter permease subunit [Phycisphaerae bacterium]|nr:ABC transporter permease subunit [Phycisphaerae bacterium]
MKIYAIAKVTFLQVIRQPIYGVLLLLCLGLMVLAPSLTMLTMDDDNKMLQDLCLSTILVAGVVLAAVAGSEAVSAEIEDQTILTIISKPVNRLELLVAKFLAVMAALALACTFMTVTFLMVLRHGVMWAAYLERDWPIIVFGLSAAVITLFVAAIGNYLFDWQFGPAALGIGLPLLSAAAVTAGFFDKSWKIQSFGQGYSIEVVSACFLLLLAIWVLAAVCIACSTRLPVVRTLLIAVVILCLGMVWDYLVLAHVQNAPSDLARAGWSALYALVPNFQIFWMLDALDLEKHISLTYILFAAGYAATYILAMLFLAYALFLDRQVGAAAKF